MKIRKVLDKKVGNKEYTKYLITLPKEVAEKSGLIEKEIKATIIEKGKIVLEKK